MTKRTIFLTTLCIITMLTIISCKKEKISEPDSNNSHNMGQNCMNCHKSGGEGEGIFIVAGTVYNEPKTNTVENPQVYLFTQPNGGGDLVVTIKGDYNGNFYTTKNFDFSAGLYPAVTRTGIIKYMQSPVSIGACNSCHGISTDKVWTN